MRLTSASVAGVSEGSDHDWLFDYLISVFKLPSWEVPIMMFVDENWSVFRSILCCVVAHFRLVLCTFQRVSGVLHSLFPLPLVPGP